MTRVFVLWNKAYSVGVEKIDDQHRQLIAILNKLYETFIDRTVGQALKEIIDELIDYTDYHFKTEEELFKQSGYPDAEDHIEEHMVFVDRINEFKRELETDSAMLTFQLMNFLRNWLIKHISGSDQEYAEHFRVKGIK